MAVVVGLGNGPLADLAIERAVEEAKLRGLELVAVAPVSMTRSDDTSASSGYGHIRERTVAEAERRAAEIAARSGVPCTAFVPPVPEHLGEAVLRAAGEFDAELIIVGMRRRTPVGKAVLGSESQDVLLGADCAVIAVKLPEDVERAL